MKELKIIKSAVDKSFGLDIAKNSRKIPYVRARSVYYRLCKDFTMFSQETITGCVKRDHATFIHANNHFIRDIFNDKKYCKIYSDLFDYLSLIFPKREEEKEHSTILKLLQEKNLLKQRVFELESQLKTSIKLTNEEEMEFLELWRSLDFQGRKDAMYKISVAKKVREKLSISIAS